MSNNTNEPNEEEIRRIEESVFELDEKGMEQVTGGSNEKNGASMADWWECPECHSRGLPFCMVCINCGALRPNPDSQ